jgi:hypothetical protein
MRRGGHGRRERPSVIHRGKSDWQVVRRKVGSHLVNDTIPGKPGIVNNDMNLAVAKSRSLVHEVLDILVIEDVADHSNGAVGFGVVDGLDDAVCLFYSAC